MRLTLQRPKLAEYNKAKSAAFRAARASASTKLCGSCKAIKPKADFGPRSKAWDGLQSWCRDCARRINRERAREKIAALRAAALDKLGRRCGRCGFCDERALQIDHVQGNGAADNAVHRGCRFYQRVLADQRGRYQTLCANCNWIKRHENREFPRRLDDAAAA